MQAKQFLQTCVAISLAVTAAGTAAQARLCVELAREEREAARAAGTCRDAAPQGSGSAPVDTAGQRSDPNSVAEWLTAPNVVGIPLRTAQARLGSFTVEQTERASPAPPGSVIEQIPRPSARVLPGQSILLIVSSGPASAGAPAVARPAKAPVARKSQAPVLQPRAPLPEPQAPVAEPEAPIPEPQAPVREAQAPVAEARAPVLATVDLPDVIGRGSIEASAALSQFQVDPIEIVADAAPSGQVLAQSPAPGTPVPLGSLVGLRLSDGSLASAAVQAPAAAPQPDPVPPAQVDAPAGGVPRNGMLLLLGGILIGTAFGALLMRQWALSRPSARESRITAPAATPPVEIGNAAAVVAATTAASEAPGVRVSARLERGETKVDFTAPGEEAAAEPAKQADE